MAKIIEMPKLSDTMEEGGIARWLKKEGDVVKEGDVLVEIETDKATMEYESPNSGTLLKILVQAGKTTALNAPIAVIGDKGEKVDIDALIAANPASGPAKKESAPKKDTPAKSVAAPTPAPVVAAPAAQRAEQPAPALKQSPGGRVKSSPLARKIAEEKGIDLAAVQGSGPNGRVILRDLDNAPTAGTKSAKSSERVVNYTPRAVSASGEDTFTPASMMRKTIAKRLHAAKNDAPHFYLTISANMTKMTAWRESLNQEAEKSALPKASVNDLVIMAVAKALKLHPGVNASWESPANGAESEGIRQFGQVHVAMAVALPTGLVTPVIRNTDHLGIRDIAFFSRDLATKAKAGQLTNEDYAGGTFTISNLGMFGIEEFTAIINPPQAAILAVGAVIKQPAVDEKGQVVAQSRMKMTMSCDHRVIDGAMGAQFLQTLVKYLEDPLMMLA